MSEILKKRLIESKGKTVKIFLHNNFRFRGKCLDSDERYLEILDFKSDNLKIIEIEQIKEMEVEE